ncbi:MAG: hypothetical protein L6Q63_02505 [Giesbergeria sp.]|nr:hypothetical protein [Giesbergeria sp.]
MDADQTGNGGNDLSLGERLQVLEALVDAAIWGPHLHNRDHRRAIAQALYMRLEGDLQAHACPARVRAELLDVADALAEIDSQPGPIKSALRPLVQPDQPPRPEL